MTITELKEKLEEIRTKTAQQIDAKIEAGEALSDEEERSIKDNEKQMELIQRSIKAKEVETRSIETPFIAVDSEKEVEAKDEVRDFFDYVKGEKREITSSTEGFTIPTVIQSKVVERVAPVNGIRQSSAVMSTKSKNSIPVSADDTVLDYIAEGASYPSADASLNEKVFAPIKFGGTVLITDEMLADSEVNLEAYIVNQLSRARTKKENDLFVNGTGTNQPTGVLVGGTDVADSSAANNAITVAELREFMFNLDADFMPNAKWLMNSKTVGYLKGLSDITADFTVDWDAGKGCWVVEGKEVILNSNMPDMGSGTKPIVFGDFSYYQIIDREVSTMKRLNEKYADQGKVGFQYTTRSDAKPLLAEAFQIFNMAV